MATTDLDILLPEEDTVEFTANDKRYKVRLFIPSVVAVFLIEHADELREIMPSESRMPKISKATYDLVMKILGIVFYNQNPELDEEFIRKHISAPRQVAIVIKFAMPLYKFIKEMGFLEAVMPEDKEAES